MAMQYSVAVRNARLDAVETTIGTSAVLRLRSGAKPANCAAARTGTIIAELSLPSDWMEAAGATTAGEKGKLGTWQDLSANNGGTIGHFEILDSTGTTCHVQGSVTATGGGGDMEVNNAVVTAGQEINVTAFKLIAGNP